MHQSPRIRRCRNDFAALLRLVRKLDLPLHGAGRSAEPLRDRVQGPRVVARSRQGQDARDTPRRDQARVVLSGTIPELRWITPVYHPNISEIGMVCLGGYGTHWVPSVQLDELCVMLWDMARYHNYIFRSPYNREAALWVANQTNFRFPMDERPLRDLARAALGRIEHLRASELDGNQANGGVANGGAGRVAARPTPSRTSRRGACGTSSTSTG